MKALVTGGTGFIGSHLVDVLLGEGWSVRCLVRNPRSVPWIGGLSVELCTGDCCSPASLGQAVAGVDVVFHLAGTTKSLNARTFIEVNAIGTDNILHACIDFNPGIKAFVYVSSQAAAGPSFPGSGRTEAEECTPVSDYGRSKLRGEELVLSQSTAIPVTVVRPPVVYGPRDRSLLPFFKLLARGIRPSLAGRRAQRFSLCYVGDLVRGLLAVSRKKEASGHIFFFSDGGAYTWGQIGDAFGRAVGRNSHELPVPESALRTYVFLADVVAAIRRRPGPLNGDKVKEMTCGDWVCNSEKSVRLLGFEPLVTLEEGARLTFKWYKGVKWL